ncbi:MAG: prefoldin subunit beta [Candidatus Pacearchaeota archaeon]|nr:prefoldin subunit beta [Candidatus Pacearchaeota archaeon]
MSDKSQEKRIEELQILEQNLQNILLQKQAFQIELRETQAALKELEKSGDEVFKIIGQLMIKTDKKNMKEELTNKEKIIDMRIKSFEKQERMLSEKLEELQREVLK